MLQIGQIIGVDGEHNSSLDTNLCSGTCQTSSDIDESP